jgi:hypothetical protein
MKFLKNIKNINKKLLVLLTSTTLFIGCQDYLDVDTDTDNSTKAPLNFLLSNIEINTSEIGDFNFNSGQILAVYTHQMNARAEEDQYGVKVDNIAMQNDWNGIYTTLKDIEDLLKISEEGGNKVYLGIGQLHKAYLMSVAVDLWGDVPFTEATKLVSGIRNPKFDNQKDIYAAVFKLINDGKANILTNSGLQKPGKDDFFYGGSIAKWVKFANTFKLKLYNQTRLSQNFDQVGFDDLITENNFFTSNADDFEFTHYNSITKSNERNRLYIESYESTQFGSYPSPWFYEILKGVNPNIHTGNPDPRMKYYFYTQLESGVFPPDQGDPTTGNPKADYWDKSTGFYSIRFGSTGPYRDASAENSYTYPGIFLCGGRYDDDLRYRNATGAVITIDALAGSGAAPRRILTYDEMLYIQAELIQAGKLTGDASAKLDQAIKASFAKVDKVVSNAKLSTQTVPALSGNTAVPIFIGKIITEFNAASPEKKLEIIMTQKWVGTAGDPLDQYTDYRRTGYPTLVNPNGTEKEYQLDNGDAFPIVDSQTVLNNPYQVSFFWPQSELNSNNKAPAQKNPATYKIFWDN